VEILQVVADQMAPLSIIRFSLMDQLLHHPHLAVICSRISKNEK